jgi:hypothetical protein
MLTMGPFNLDGGHCCDQGAELLYYTKDGELRDQLRDHSLLEGRVHGVACF